MVTRSKAAAAKPQTATIHTRARPPRLTGPAPAVASGPSAANEPAANGPLDPIPVWPQLKLDIVRRYGAAYSTIASRQPGLAHYWIDGFIRPGADNSAGPFAPGSALNALLVTPPFRHHWLVSMNGQPADALRRAVDGRADVTVLEGGSRALLEDVLPRVRQEEYRRALCVLDPCGPGLDWRAIELAGRLRTIDLFVALDGADGTPAALKRRLREDAGFANILEPLALRDRSGRTAAHLFFASRNNMANGVVEDIFTTWRDGRREGEARA